MLDALLAALFGPLGGILAGVVSVLVALVLGRWQGRKQAETRAASDYRNTRKEIDNADLGIGASDSQRIDRLRGIADRRGAGKD